MIETPSSHALEYAAATLSMQSQLLEAQADLEGSPDLTRQLRAGSEELREVGAWLRDLALGVAQ